MALKGGVFAISGNLSLTRAEYFKKIKSHGGKTASSVTNSVTHLICSEDEYHGNSNKVVAAKGKDVWIICEEFVDQCIFTNELIELDGTEGEYLWNPKEAAKPSSAAATKKRKGKAAPAPAPSGRGAQKRKDSPKEDDGKARSSKRGKKTNKSVEKESEGNDEDVTMVCEEGEYITDINGFDEVNAVDPKVEGPIYQEKNGAINLCVCSKGTLLSVQLKRPNMSVKIQLLVEKSEDGEEHYFLFRRTVDFDENSDVTDLHEIKAGKKRGATAKKTAEEAFKSEFKQKTGLAWEKRTNKSRGEFIVLRTGDPHKCKQTKIEDNTATAKASATTTRKTEEKPAKLSGKLKKSQSVMETEAVDPNFSTHPNERIYCDPSNGIPFSVLLVQNDRSKNMDKYYKIQLLTANWLGFSSEQIGKTVNCDKSGQAYSTYIRFGKTGTSGQVQVISGGPEKAAVDAFKDKFKEKTGRDWDDGLGNFKQKKGKYNVVKTRKPGSTTTQAQAPPPGQIAMWQYYLENDLDGKPDGWYDYYPDANKTVEECYGHFLTNSWLDVRYVQSGYFSYKVDYKNMTQTNITHHNHTTRTIRRNFKAAPQATNSINWMPQPTSVASSWGSTFQTMGNSVLNTVNAGVSLFSSPFKPAAPAPPSIAYTPPKPAPATTPKKEAKKELKVVEKLDIINDESLKGVVVPKVKAYKANKPNQPQFPHDYEILANCVLQITDIKNNNNKYYSLELHEGARSSGKNLYRLYTHYGRTDDLATKGHDSGQKETRYYETLEIAKAGYLKIYKEKTSNKKGYKPVNLVSSKIGSEKARNQAAGSLGSATQAKLKDDTNSPMKSPTKVVKKKPLNLAAPVRQLIEYIYAEAKETLTSTVDVEITANGIETPLGILSVEQVEEGENVLREIAKEVKKKKKSRNKLLDLSGQFYTTIPHKIGRTRDQIKDAVISNLAEVAEKQDLCQLMRDMLQVSAEGTNVLYDKDATDEQYKALKCNIDVLSKSTKEFKDLVKHIKTSQERSHGDVFIQEDTIVNIFKVRRPEEEARFTTKVTTNHQLLFHGSRLSNFVGLLSRGILLPKIVVSMGVTRTDGGWLGDGIYFGDADTSNYYAQEGEKGTKLMLINLVALGKMKDFSEITYGLTSPPPGYDSCHGVPGTEFDDDEYVVYTEEQQKIQYLVETNV